MGFLFWGFLYFFTPGFFVTRKSDLPPAESILQPANNPAPARGN
jgi:hypothetical protein